MEESHTPKMRSRDHGKIDAKQGRGSQGQGGVGNRLPLVALAKLQIPGSQREQGKNERFSICTAIGENMPLLRNSRCSLALICKRNLSQGASPKHYRDIW